MRVSAEVYTITEFGGFVRGETVAAGYQSLPAHTFDALEAFLLANRNGEETDRTELLSLSVRKGVGKTITARNYVGLITMKDGTVIEILPKISGQIGLEETKRVFLDMLRTSKEALFKDLQTANLKVARMNLFEVFIAMFLQEVDRLVKQGLKSAYNTVEENERFYRGKLLLSQHMKHNLIRRDRFFVAHDEWHLNRPENRLLKATLRLLFRASGSDGNRTRIGRLLPLFDEVGPVVDVGVEFSKCAMDRGVTHYAKALAWSKVFLCGNSFTSFSGSEVAVALLFPMEKVFERYVAAKLRRVMPAAVAMRTQDQRFSLFDKPRRVFQLRPDIVLEETYLERHKQNETRLERSILNMTGRKETGVEEASGGCVVLDTKWKLLNAAKRNAGIAQSDMYQMYAYAKKYAARKVVLLYPRSDECFSDELRFESDDGVCVDVWFVDLQRMEDSMKGLVGSLFSQVVALGVSGQALS